MSVALINLFTVNTLCSENHFETFVEASRKRVQILWYDSPGLLFKEELGVGPVVEQDFVACLDAPGRHHFNFSGRFN